MKKTIVLLALITYIGQLECAIYSCNLSQALIYLQQETNETTCVFVNIDLDGMEQLLTRDYKEPLKRAQSLCQKQHKEGYELIATINNTMKVINPTYLAAAHITPNCIGMTRRKLRWSHLVRGACYDHGIKKEAQRMLVMIPTENPEYPKIIECNTGIIYCDDARYADAIYNYIRKWQPNCKHIIMIDTKADAIQQCMINLHALRAPKVTGLLVQNQ